MKRTRTHTSSTQGTLLGVGQVPWDSGCATTRTRADDLRVRVIKYTLQICMTIGVFTLTTQMHLGQLVRGHVFEVHSTVVLAGNLFVFNYSFQNEPSKGVAIESRGVLLRFGEVDALLWCEVNTANHGGQLSVTHLGLTTAAPRPFEERDHYSTHEVVVKNSCHRDGAVDEWDDGGGELPYQRQRPFGSRLRYTSTC